MKAIDIRELTEEELQERYDDVQQELFNLRMQKSTAQLENPARLRILRRDMARIKTIINDRKREGASS